MKKKHVLIYILAVLTLSAAYAQTLSISSNRGSAQPLSEYSSSLSLFPLPPPVSIGPKDSEAPLFTYGFDERVRTEDWNPLFDFNNASKTGEDYHEQLRFRTRVQAGVSTPHSEMQLNVRLVNETYKNQVNPEQNLTKEEVIVDNMYLQFNKTYIPGFSISAGRQDWMKNDGFLFMDGSSGDGSRTSYFNMVNLAYTHKKSKLEVVGILDPRREHLFPIVHNVDCNLNEWNEQAAGVYYTDRNHKDTDVDAFYMLKKEINDYRAPSNILFQPDKHVNTIGGRVLQRLPNGLSVRGEAALQFDSLHANPAQSLASTSFTAFGGYLLVTKQFNAIKGKPYIEGGYTVLSGSTKQADGAGFDPLFSRWPRYSELYVYSQVDEKGVAYATNDRIVTGEVGFTPSKAITLRAKLDQHNAIDSVERFNPSIYGSGTNRGENFQARGDVVLNKNWQGHILYEKWLPGKFYAHQDPGYFFRAEVTYIFRDRFFAPTKN